MGMGIKITPADKWFSLCVKERVGWTCERCGHQYNRGDQGLQCAHYWGRSYWAVRFNPCNAFALCFHCHQMMDSAAELFHKFYLSKFPQVKLTYVSRLSNDRDVANVFRATKGKGSIAAFYKETYETLLHRRAQGIITRLEFPPFTPEP